VSKARRLPTRKPHGLTMSDEQDEKTERASERRLQSARENGDIAVARDVGMLATLGAGGAVLSLVGASLRDALVNLVYASADGLGNPSADRLVPYLSRPTLITLLGAHGGGHGGVSGLSGCRPGLAFGRN
jgi:hypothetical protein